MVPSPRIRGPFALRVLLPQLLLSLPFSLPLACATPVIAAPAKVQLPTGRCLAVGKTRVHRVGDPWLLLGAEPLGRTDTDFRVATLQLRLFDERTATIRTLDVPLATLRQGLAPGMGDKGLEWTNAKGAKRDGFDVDVVHVGDDATTVALMIDVAHKGGGTTRSLALWTVGSATLRLVPGLQTLAPKERGYLVVAGVDATGGLLLLDVRPAESEGDTRKLALVLHRVDLAAARSAVVWRFLTPARRNSRLSIDRHLRLSRDRALLVIPEYLEDPTGEAEVHVVRLADGSHRSLPTPATTYGVDISPDGKTLALGSNRQGSVELWDLATGKRTATAKSVKRLHKLVYGKDGTVIWAVGKGGNVVALDPSRLRSLGSFAAKALGGGAGALFAQLPPAPGGAPQSFGLVSDTHGFGEVETICVLPL